MEPFTMRKHIILPLLLAAMLTGCQSSELDFSNATSKSVGNETTMVYQIGSPVSASITSSVSIKKVVEYDKHPVFFKKDTSLTKNNFVSLLQFLGIPSNVEDEQYLCDGTSFYSYSERKYSEKEKTVSFSEDQTGVVTIGLFASLEEKKISWPNGNSITVYVAADSPVFSYK